MLTNGNLEVPAKVKLGITVFGSNWGSEGLIKVKRVYDAPSKDDGFRVLVDRLWPRGLSKDKAKVDLWLKDIAPSDALRKWYLHDPAKWPEFKRRYSEELKGKKEAVDLIAEKAKKGVVTFLYSSREEKLNNAHALKEYIESKKR